MKAEAATTTSSTSEQFTISQELKTARHTVNRQKCQRRTQGEGKEGKKHTSTMTSICKAVLNVFCVRTLFDREASEVKR